MIIINNLFNSDQSFMVGVLLMVWTKEFTVLKGGGYKRDAVISKNNLYTNHLITTIIQLWLIFMLPNSMEPRCAPKIAFFFMIKALSLFCISAYYYGKGSDIESPLTTEYKELREFICLLTFPVVNKRINMIPPMNKRNLAILNLDTIGFWDRVELRTTNLIIPIVNIVRTTHNIRPL